MSGPRRLAVVGGGPAGLMAAQTARAAGLEVDLYERMGSVGRKFLLAGKGGLNLTHSEPRPAFDQRYAERATAVGGWLDGFDAQALRDWAQSLGVETFVGTSGRVFPQDLKAAPLLRGWVRRLRAGGVRFHMQHRLCDLHGHGPEALSLDFDTPAGPVRVETDAVILALGGASWPQLGSDGTWVGLLDALGADLAPLRPANCGFDVEWSAHFAQRYAGQAIKSAVLHWTDRQGQPQSRQGECIATASGIEGGLIYAASGDLREAIARHGEVTPRLDLAPTRSEAELAAALSRPRGSRSIGDHLRRQTGIEGVRAGLLFEMSTPQERAIAPLLATRIKSLPLRLLRPRPIAEAISSAGGLRLEGLDPGLMLRGRPGVFAAGEMLDWEAPTGGYLLTACMASAHHAAVAAVRFLG